MAQPDYHIKRLETIRALGIRFTARNHLHFARLCAEVRAAAQAQPIPVIGYPIQIVYGVEYRENDVETEFVLPIDASWTNSVPLATFGSISVRELPEIEASACLQTGSHDTLNEGLDDLRRWVSAQGYQLAGSIRMIYLRGFVVPLPVEQRLFEIQYPLEKA